MTQKRVQLISMTLARSGTFGTQYRRPYDTNGQGHVINMFQERFAQMGNQGGLASPQLFAGIAGEFMKPQAAPEAKIMIPNDWGTERYYFILEVLVLNAMGGQTREVIQGFTSFTDPSYANNIDPRMQFFINSITTIKDAQMPGQFGMMSVPSVVSSYHVLANNAYNGPDTLGTGSLHNSISMRPQDVMGAIQTYPMVADDLTDLRSSHTTVPKASARSNTLASNYTGKMVGSWAMASAKEHQTEGHIVADAYGMVADGRGLTADLFIRTISGINNAPITNFFTYQDLLRVDPTFDDRCTIIKDAPVIKMGNGMLADVSAGNFQDWGGSTFTHQAAAILSASMPALMVEAGLRSMELIASNKSGIPYIRVAMCSPIVFGMQLNEIQLSRLEQRIQSELLDDISMQGQLMYDLTASVYLAQQSVITIQLENEPPTVFSMPTFADALSAPVITHTADRLQNVSMDFSNLMNSLVQVQTPTVDAMQGKSFADI
jgi:hypothetical protein